MHQTLLKVENLKKYFPVYGGIFYRQTGKVYAVDDVSFAIKYGEVLGLVGESGCGKSTLGRTLMYLDPPTAGHVDFLGRRLADLSSQGMRAIRRDLQIIFQDPYESLNPRHSVQQILEEPFLIHQGLSKVQREAEVRRLLDIVGLPEQSKYRYPHEFSGGQRQRIGIARAIALKPKLIICDEPVSALDVSIQSQIVNLLLELQQEMQLSYVFIAHDLTVVKHISDRIAVMYLGKIVEIGNSEEIYRNPRHPYTEALIEAIPVPDPKKKRQKRLLTGDVPSPKNPPAGCRFNTRCPIASELCQKEEPKLKTVSDKSDHQYACHNR